MYQVLSVGSQEPQLSLNLMKKEYIKTPPIPPPEPGNSPILLHFIVSGSERGNNKSKIILVLKDYSNTNTIILAAFSPKLVGEKTEKGLY